MVLWRGEGGDRMSERFWFYVGYPALYLFGRDSALYGWTHIKWLRAYVAKCSRTAVG